MISIDIVFRKQAVDEYFKVSYISKCITHTLTFSLKKIVKECLEMSFI